MSRNGSTSPFPTIDTVLPARNRRVVPGSRVTWLSRSALREIGSRSDQADRCAAGAAHDRERHEQERRGGVPPDHRNPETSRALAATLRGAAAHPPQRPVSAPSCTSRAKHPYLSS